MSSYLLARRAVSVAQFPSSVLARLRNEGQDRLIALLPLVLRVVALARSHLVSVQRVHRRIRIQRYRLQSDVRCCPDTFSHLALDRENLILNVDVQRCQKAPERRLPRQLLDLQNPCKNRIPRDEPQLVEPRKTNVYPQHHRQHELVHRHYLRLARQRHFAFHQRLEPEVLQHCRNRQQTAVRRKILRREVKRRGSPDFIRVARCLTKDLFGALLRAILVRDHNHLGDLLGVQGLQSCSLRKSLLPHNHGGPQMVPHLFTPRSRLGARIVQVA